MFTAPWKLYAHNRNVICDAATQVVRAKSNVV